MHMKVFLKLRKMHTLQFYLEGSLYICICRVIYSQQTHVINFLKYQTWSSKKYLRKRFSPVTWSLLTSGEKGSCPFRCVMWLRHGDGQWDDRTCLRGRPPSREEEKANKRLRVTQGEWANVPNALRPTQSPWTLSPGPHLCCCPTFTLKGTFHFQPSKNFVTESATWNSTAFQGAFQTHIYSSMDSVCLELNYVLPKFQGWSPKPQKGLCLDTGRPLRRWWRLHQVVKVGAWPNRTDALIRKEKDTKDAWAPRNGCVKTQGGEAACTPWSSAAGETRPAEPGAVCWGSITRHHRLGGFTVSQSWRLGVQDQGAASSWGCAGESVHVPLPGCWGLLAIFGVPWLVEACAFTCT